MRKALSFFSIGMLLILAGCEQHQNNFDRIEDRIANIYPDYSSITIPVNIAPLNFIIQEDAEYYQVRFSGEGKTSFTRNSKNGKIIIPIKKWKVLLGENKGDTISIEISIKKEKQWIAFRTIKNFVSTDSLDPFLVYRKINSALILWNDMAIIQRSTETFEESAILENKNTDGNCMHCHAFQNHNPKNMMLHLRTPPGGTYIRSNDSVRWLSTKTPYTLASFAYPAWHPTKNYIAFSTNNIHQLMYGSGDRLNYVYDTKSDVVVYDVTNNLVFTSPKISGNDLENLPNWSPDGSFLYYINCPENRQKTDGIRVKYDLMRIPFNADTHEWGDVDTLLSSNKTGLSITFPEASPDGRFIIFCMADYGYFTIGNSSSDLYILDLRDGKYRKLDINSRQTESFHNWSLNSRWLVFASKREDGITTLPYFTHIDEDGKESKPFVLPSKDPGSLLTRLFNYNRPVLVTGKIDVSQKEMLSDIYGPTKNVVFDSTTITSDTISPGYKSDDGNESSIYKKQ